MLGHLLAVYTIVGAALALPLSMVWARELTGVRHYLATAVGVAAVLTVAVVLRARRLAVGAALIIPVVAAAAWYLFEVHWNPAFQELAADGDPASIAAILRGRERGWLGAIGPATVTGSLSSLLYALFWMWKLDRADRDLV